MVAEMKTKAKRGRMPHPVASPSETGYAETMKTLPALCLGLLLSSIFFCGARADQIEMQNGDRYHGKVLAMTNATLVLQSEILGTIKLPREKVSLINLGDAVRTNSAKRINSRVDNSIQRKPLLTGPAGTATATTNSPTPSTTAEQNKL